MAFEATARENERPEQDQRRRVGLRLRSRMRSAATSLARWVDAGEIVNQGPGYEAELHTVRRHGLTTS